MDGCTLDTEGEMERVIKCIEAAIQRRVSEVSEKLFKEQSILRIFHVYLVLFKVIYITFF